MPATRKVKVRCSDRDGCSWSSERQARPTLVDGEFHRNILTVPDHPCPKCGGRVELVGRTNPNRQEA